MLDGNHRWYGSPYYVGNPIIMGFEKKIMHGHRLAMVQETIKKKIYPLGNSNFNTLILTIGE